MTTPQNYRKPVQHGYGDLRRKALVLAAEPEGVTSAALALHARVPLNTVRPKLLRYERAGWLSRALLSDCRTYVYFISRAGRELLSA